MANLVDRNVLITGGSRGLGAQIAKDFWTQGANLFLVARDEKSLKETLNHLEPRAGQKVGFFCADLGEADSIRKIMEGTRSFYDHLDILVNNAAIQGPIGAVWENDWEAWQKTIAVDLLAPVALCRAVSVWMIPQRSGKIISISGGGATGARPNFSAYAVAKTGLVRFSEILAAELLSYNIQVNCVSPGAMPTSMLEQVVKAGPDFAGQKEYSSAKEIIEKPSTTLKRATELVGYLASSASDNITGKLISAVWDPWETLDYHRDDLNKSDIYTLRRIVPKDRGLDWGEK